MSVPEAFHTHHRCLSAHLRSPNFFEVTSPVLTSSLHNSDRLCWGHLPPRYQPRSISDLYCAQRYRYVEDTRLHVIRRRFSLPDGNCNFRQYVIFPTCFSQISWIFGSDRSSGIDVLGPKILISGLVPFSANILQVALFVDLEIPLPTEPVTPPSSGLLVWGASSSIGTATIQIARNLGFKVFATASPTHHKYLKSLGAFAVFDYHDSSVVDKIVASARDHGVTISLGFDAITEGDTARQSSEVILSSGGKGGKLVLANAWPESDKPQGLQISQTMAYRHGADQAEIGEWLFNDYLAKSLADGTIVPAPEIEVVPGGLGGAQAALDKLKAGVSGRKLVVKVE